MVYVGLNDVGSNQVNCRNFRRIKHTLVKFDVLGAVITILYRNDKASGQNLNREMKQVSKGKEGVTFLIEVLLQIEICIGCVGNE